MDIVNEITSKPSTTQENGLSEIENTNETTTNQNDDSSSLIENVKKTIFKTFLKVLIQNPIASSQVPTMPNGDEVSKNQNNDSSWLIENVRKKTSFKRLVKVLIQNPTTSSQSDDVTKSQVPTVFNGDAFGYINEITKNQNHDSSWLIESVRKK